MRKTSALLVGLGVLGVVGCSSNEEYIRDLRAALDQAQVTLPQSVTLAETASEGSGINAALLVRNDPIFSVDTLGAELRDVRVDIVSGDVVSMMTLGQSSGLGSCPDSIPLSEALTIAEGHARGSAVASVPDDDVACAFEIQVLRGDTLWEVKVAGDGRVLEYEESDEDGSGEED